MVNLPRLRQYRHVMRSGIATVAELGRKPAVRFPSLIPEATYKEKQNEKPNNESPRNIFRRRPDA
jgi:hypothetical protein